MGKFKAKFNVNEIINGDANYADSFIELVTKYKDKIIEVEEELFGGYELELEGSTYALDEIEVIVIGEVDKEGTMTFSGEELEILQHWGFIASTERPLSEKEKELYFRITDV